MTTYTAVSGQSLYDVCEITYGSLDFLMRLATDNGITDLNDTNLSQKIFIYDNSLIVNQTLHQQLNQNYGTANNIDVTTNGYGAYSDAYGGAYG